MGAPLTYAPFPRAAHHRRPSAGADTTPTTVSEPERSASSVAHTGAPRTKFFVPSIGSTTQQRSASPRTPYSSPTTASPGRSDARRSRTICSTARSASVTGVRSGLVSTTRSRARKRAVVILSASSASASAKARSRLRSASMTIRPRSGVGIGLERDGALLARVHDETQHVGARVVARGIEHPPRGACPREVDVGDDDPLLAGQRTGEEDALRADDGAVAAAQPVVVPAVQRVETRERVAHVGAAQARRGSDHVHPALARD